MRIGYAKLGRAIHLNPKNFGMQGDPAAPQLIRRLALRNPQHEFVIASKSDSDLSGMPPNVTDVWEGSGTKAQWSYQGPGKPLLPVEHGIAFEREVVVPAIAAMDGFILDLGQHGTSHTHIPQTPNTWREAEDSALGVPIHKWLSDRGTGRWHEEEEHPAKCSCLFTHSHAWARQYGASVMRGMNAMNDRMDGAAPTVYICEDNRNYVKARDIKWPTGLDDILAMHEMERKQVHERFRDTRRPGDTQMLYDFPIEVERGGELWRATHRYRHSGAELMILPDDWGTNEASARSFEERLPAGVGSTSFWVGNPAERRSRVLLDWWVPVFPDAPVYGKFDKKSLEEWGDRDAPVENDASTFLDLLSTFRVSVVLPSIGRLSGGGEWVTGKAVQLWAAGVAAFFIGGVDSHGWLLPSRTKVHDLMGEVAPGWFSVRGDWDRHDFILADWLRADTPERFAANAKVLAEDRTTWEWIVQQQRRILDARWEEALLERTIEYKLCLRA